MKRVVERIPRQAVGAAAAAATVVALAATTAAVGSSTNPKHFVGPSAVPTYGPNNYVVTFGVDEAITGYGTPDVTGSLNLWTVGDQFTTKQEWTSMDANRITDTTVRPDTGTGFVRGAHVTTSPVLGVQAPGYITLSDNFYSFEGDYGADVVVANDGGAAGSLAGGGTLVLMQTAAGINPDYRPVFNVGDVTAPATGETFGQITGGALTVTKADGSALPAAAQTVLFDKNFQVASTPTNFGNLPYQELIWGVWLPGWTGDVKVGFELPVHSMFSSIRFDTAIGSMNGTPGLENFELAPLYWDTNGTTAGAGGAAPAGNWNGTAANFNFDPAGGTLAGATTGVTSGSRGVVFTAGTDGGGTYTVNVSGTQTAASLRVDRGNVSFAGNGTINTPSIQVAAGARAQLGSGITTSPNLAVTVGAGGTLAAQAGTPAALDVATVNVNATGRVDLNDAGLVKRNGGSGAAGQSATRQLTALLKTGIENGGVYDWQGPGISSTEAFNDNALSGSVLYGVGIVQNNQAAALVGDGTTTDETPGNEIFTTFKGRTVQLNDTLVRYTYMGDSDLDGAITGTDYTLIDNGFAFGLSGWINGDYDYSGVIDGTDYTLIDNAFAFQVGILSEAFQARYNRSVALFGDGYVEAFARVQAGVVPEPATAAVVALASCGALVVRPRRRRRCPN